LEKDGRIRVGGTERRQHGYQNQQLVAETLP